jgi:hypothetical protein
MVRGQAARLAPFNMGIKQIRHAIKRKDAKATAIL